MLMRTNGVMVYFTFVKIRDLQKAIIVIARYIKVFFLNDWSKFVSRS